MSKPRIHTTHCWIPARGGGVLRCFIVTRLSICRTVGVWGCPRVFPTASLHFVSKHKLYSQEVWGGLCLLDLSLELSKAECQALSKLSLPRCATSITEAERLWVRINTTLNLYTFLFSSLRVLSPIIFSDLIECHPHLINKRQVDCSFSCRFPFCSMSYAHRHLVSFCLLLFSLLTLSKHTWVSIKIVFWKHFQFNDLTRYHWHILDFLKCTVNIIFHHQRHWSVTLLSISYNHSCHDLFSYPNCSHHSCPSVVWAVGRSPKK